MKNFESKYKSSLGIATTMYTCAKENNDKEMVQSLELIFPELKENEDEKIKKEILNVFKQFDEGTVIFGRKYDYAKWIAWLEKQGEQDNKAAPKFKVGDWIINSEGMLRHIVDVDKTGYQTDNGWLAHDTYERDFHLWTIEDAKNGDILALDDHILMIKWIKFNNPINQSEIHCWCHLINGNFKAIEYQAAVDGLHPATKEQRNILFQKMKEAGYEWNATSKELKTVERDLMERPSDESVRKAYSGLLRLGDALQHTFYGSQMHDSKFHGGEDTWSFPEGVREKLKDNERYRVWYTKHDAADPCDTSCHYCVHYIKKI